MWNSTRDTLNEHPVVVIIGLLAAIATICGTCLAFFQYFNNKTPSINELTKPTYTWTILSDANETLPVPKELENTPIKLNPSSTFTPSDYQIDYDLDCTGKINKVIECIENELFIIGSGEFWGRFLDGTISSPGFPSLEFKDLSIGHSIYFHNGTKWYEIRYDDSAVGTGNFVYFHIYVYKNK
jgi:hypothetical protein